MLRYFLFTITVLSLSFLSLNSFASTAEEKGLAIARAADAKDQGFQDSMAALTMILRDAQGQEATRQLLIKTLEAPKDDAGDWSLVVFHSPADVKGTALLTHAEILEADNQWLYLPALKRVKRIASGNRAGPFMGSEFAYEDMAAAEVDKYSYRYLRTEPCGALMCEVIERKPKYKYSGYTKMLVWIDKQHLRNQRIEYYDRRGEHSKTLVFKAYRLYGEKYWRAHDLVMTNHKTGKSTQLLWSRFKFGAGLDEADFSRTSLTRQ
ncbi:MAG: outer membrane lipoprotein-sorting protein [Sphingomonadales bacterium]